MYSSALVAGCLLLSQTLGSATDDPGGPADPPGVGLTADDYGSSSRVLSRGVGRTSGAASSRIRVGSDEDDRADRRRNSIREPVDDIAARGVSQTAIAAVRYAMTPPERGLIGGRSVALQELMERISGTSERTTVAKAYWRLTDAIMAYHLAFHEARFLESLPTPNSATDEVQLEAARTDGLAVESEALEAVMEAQFALADVGRLSTTELPVPTDLPLVIPYRTRLAEIFPGDTAPRELRRVDRLLPVILETIIQRADAVSSTVRATESIRDSYANGQSNIAVLLDTHANLHRQRDALLASVRRYNDLIADYAMRVSGGNASSDQAVAMLIGSGRRNNFVNGDVVPATANLPYSQRRAD